MALEKIVNMFQDIHQHSRKEGLFIVFDEVQYLPKWEIHLKSLVAVNTRQISKQDFINNITFNISGTVFLCSNG
jgi:predicted AAA+ superfamily ATPase